MDSKEIAATFSAARQAARALDAYPGGVVPPTLEAAYAVQDIAIRSWPDQLVGWKVALIQPAWRESYPAERLAGPVFARQLWDAKAGEVTVSVTDKGYAAVEAEFAIRIGKDIPLDAVFTSATELLQYVDGIHAAVELAGSPLQNLNVLGPGAVVSDFGINGGLVVGARLPDEVLTNPSTCSSRVEINQQLCGEGDASKVPGGPLQALLFLFGNLISRGRTLKAGDWVSTGATTGIHKVQAGDQVAAVFNGEQRILMRIQAAGAAK